jgi:hypothetical protein
LGPNAEDIYLPVALPASGVSLTSNMWTNSTPSTC